MFSVSYCILRLRAGAAAFIIFVLHSCFIAALQPEPRWEEIRSSDQVLLIYNDEADILFLKKEYASALEKYQKVIQFLQDNELSDPSNLLYALCGSFFCYDILQQDSFAQEAFNELVYEVGLLNEKIEEIRWFNQSQIYPFFKQNPDRYNLRVEKIGLPNMTPEENCQMQCNGYAVAAAYACSKVVHPALQFACYGCIFGLEQLCMQCCKGEGFWTNCVKGLRRLFHDPEHPDNPAPHPYE